MVLTYVWRHVGLNAVTSHGKPCSAGPEEPRRPGVSAKETAARSVGSNVCWPLRSWESHTRHVTPPEGLSVGITLREASRPNRSKEVAISCCQCLGPTGNWYVRTVPAKGSLPPQEILLLRLWASMVGWQTTNRCVTATNCFFFFFFFFFCGVLRQLASF